MKSSPSGWDCEGFGVGSQQSDGFCEASLCGGTGAPPNGKDCRAEGLSGIYPRRRSQPRVIKSELNVGFVLSVVD